ncbi:metal-sensing transcriptional repressor [Erythrobacter vulgaris]|uniref:Metal-sensing transcriptional repressor n=1 Tax=Qipengyuania vulgaris TaxID=291985 RepID=A0A844XRU5_9SPHN|nr:metal-sensing transcriptional repressor [Qipengyuania vulgaris]
MRLHQALQILKVVDVKPAIRTWVLQLLRLLSYIPRRSIARYPAGYCSRWSAKNVSATDGSRIVNRLRRIEGQVRGVAQMIEDDRYCIDVLNQVQAIKAALGRAESEILKRHAACCVAEAIASGDPDEQKQKFGELVDLFEKAKR